MPETWLILSGDLIRNENKSISESYFPFIAIAVGWLYIYISSLQVQSQRVITEDRTPDVVKMAGCFSSCRLLIFLYQKIRKSLTLKFFGIYFHIKTSIYIPIIKGIKSLYFYSMPTEFAINLISKSFYGNHELWI